MQKSYKRNPQFITNLKNHTLKQFRNLIYVPFGSAHSPSQSISRGLLCSELWKRHQGTSQV